MPIVLRLCHLNLSLDAKPSPLAVCPTIILAGTLDALSAVADFGKAGRLRILGVDFFGGNALPENGYLFYRDGRQSTYNLRGETNTLRTGFVYEYDRSKAKSMPIDLRAYYFYAAIGGGPIEESGADITFGGALAIIEMQITSKSRVADSDIRALLARQTYGSSVSSAAPWVSTARIQMNETW